MNTNLMPAVSNMLMGIIFLAIGVPLLKRKIKINDLYGFRTSKAFESEENWYNINAYFGKHLSICSIVVILLGVVFLFAPINEDLRLFIAIGPIVLSFIISIITTLVYEHNL